jgi:uncharacterized protein with HEPN domain
VNDDTLYLIHIGECIARIERYVVDGREGFIGSTLIQDAMLRNLQTIGQSVGRLSEVLCDTHPEINRGSIIGWNVLVHDYLDINLERIWEIIEHDLPDLKHTIEALLQEPGGA